MDLADALGEGLALLAGKLLAKLGLARYQLVADGHQDLVALFQSAALPYRLSGDGRIEGLLHLRSIGLRVFAQHIRDVRRADIGDAGRSVQPFAIDVVWKDFARHMRLLSCCDRMVGGAANKLKLIVNIG
ncbi:hypothetical protein D3C76_1229610 [compost metagenome]